LDLNGRVRSIVGKDGFCNIRFQGQVYDDDIQLCYNRFRWYDDVDGRYISKDPIGLLSGEYGFYNYVGDSNSWVDPFGLEPILVNPKDVNFSQISINTKMSDAGGNPIKINDMIKKVKAANTKKGGNEIMENMKPIRVKNHKGQLVSLDNRRLYIARKSKSKVISIEMITDVETFKQLTTRLRNNGLSNDGTKKLPTCG
ncbi:RHS repeat domain-containing protein, partial [Tenacibaculum maritimum]